MVTIRSQSCSTNGHNAVTIWSQSGHNSVSCSKNGTKMATMQCGHKVIIKWSQWSLSGHSDHEVVTNSHKSDHKVVTKLTQSGQIMVTKWSQTCHKEFTKWSQNGHKNHTKWDFLRQFSNTMNLRALGFKTCLLWIGVQCFSVNEDLNFHLMGVTKVTKQIKQIRITFILLSTGTPHGVDCQ